MTLGERIKAERTRCGLSQGDVALAIGSTRQAVYKYECGIVVNIPEDKLRKMAELFEVSHAYLLGWDSSTDSDLSQKERLLILAYRDHPELQAAVDRLLDLDGDTVSLFMAASSEEGKPPMFGKMSREKWEELKNAPPTDEDLM